MSDSLWIKGLDALKLDIGLALNDQQVDQLKQYVDLLMKWNKTYNLTAVRNTQDVIIRHIFDSLVVAPHISKADCLDVGSGGGLPGIPLAIVFPEQQFTTLDTNGKKTTFMQQAGIQLGLKNLAVVKSRIELFQPDIKFQQVISRAFASIEDFVEGCASVLSDDGCLLAMKGEYPESELLALPSGFSVIEKVDLRVPYLENEQRCLIKIQRTI